MHTALRAFAASSLIVAFTVFSAATPASALTAQQRQRLAVETKLASLGLPVGAVDGIWDQSTRRGFCAWRELKGRVSTRSYLTDKAISEVLATTALPVPRKFVAGLYVNRACQVLYWVRKNSTGSSVLRAVFPVSSGRLGFETKPGTHFISSQIDGWHESTIYESAMMYRPKYFVKNEALHGSAVDSLVRPWPDSHGCVRMLHADIDALWKAKVGPGTLVKVYGDYTGYSPYA